MAKKTYAVITAIHTDRRYEPGATIDLDEADASALIAVQAIDAVAVGEVAGGSVAPADPAERQTAITAAIGQLDPNDPDVWLRDGRPDTAALAAITGWTVSAAERNAAWAAMQVTT